MELDNRLKLRLNQRISQPQNFLLAIGEIQESEAEISELEATHSLTAAQKKIVARIRLKNKTLRFVKMLQNDVSCDAERADLLQFCQSHEHESETIIGGECRYWLCALPTFEFAHAPTPETLALFSSAIEKYEGCFSDSFNRATLLGKIIETLIERDGSTSRLAQEAFGVMSERMLDSENEKVRLVGQRLKLQQVFAPYGLRDLGYRVAWKQPNATEDVKNAITALEDNLDVVSPAAWDVIMRAYEGHLANGNVKEVGAAWQRLWSLSQRVSSEQLKTQLQTKLERQKRRATLLGSKVDLSGFRLKGGEPVDFSNHKFLPIVFFGEGAESVELVRKTVKEESGPKIHYVLVFGEAFSQRVIDQIDESRGGFTVVDEATSRRYFEGLFVDQLPSIVLVDQSGTVLCSSLPFDQVKTVVTRFENRNR